MNSTSTYDIGTEDAMRALERIIAPVASDPAAQPETGFTSISGGIRYRAHWYCGRCGFGPHDPNLHGICIECGAVPS
ncbi:uncharacterized protein LAJ45_03010 [Morchella importuna]|uniref:uncharacterized protein n=1 Tax=Morchella importuna TaxID=1174673 RepID=UPI001E8D1090|nr:uncharacterized protein LAJ45_03010 [Morchella importuna]KAH8152785.1 hypothetical protein LAJ45_03010 [Morchella importuna]